MTKATIYSNAMPDTAGMPNLYSYAALLPASSFSAPADNEAFRVFLRGTGNTAKDLCISERDGAGLSMLASVMRLIKVGGLTQFALPAAGVWSDPIPFPFNVAADHIFAMDGVSGSYKRDLSAPGLVYGYKLGNGHALNPDKSTFTTTGLINTTMTIEAIETGSLADFGLGEGEPEPEPEPEPTPEEECCQMIKLSEILAGQWFSSPVTVAGLAGKYALFQVHNDLGKKVLLHMVEITPDADVVARIAINGPGELLPTVFGASSCNFLGNAAQSAAKRRTSLADSLPNGVHARYKLKGGVLHKLHPNYLLPASPAWGLIVALETQGIGATVNFTWREFT